MDEQTMDTAAQTGWEDESAPQAAGDQLQETPGVVQEADAQRQEDQRQRADLERFLRVYPDVQAEAIPLEVWRQVAQGESLVSAYALHENRQLRSQLAAERQDRANRQRTPGGLGYNISAELDEIDRMWREDD